MTRIPRHEHRLRMAFREARRFADQDRYLVSCDGREVTSEDERKLATMAGVKEILRSQLQKGRSR